MKKRLYTRSDKNLIEYDSWRTFDRQQIIATGKDHGVCRLMIPPALLRRAFGRGDKSQIGFAGTAQYDFEDTNLDLYRMQDYKQTTFYHGMNREPEFYMKQDNIRKPEHKRIREWPSVDEFWKLETPIEFRLLASE